MQLILSPSWAGQSKVETLFSSYQMGHFTKWLCELVFDMGKVFLETVKK